MWATKPMAIRPTVKTMPPMKLGPSKRRHGGAGAGFSVVVVTGATVVVFGAGVTVVVFGATVVVFGASVVVLGA